MAVIRSAEAQTMARDAIVLDLGELSRQGDVILAQARFQAQRVIEEAQAERARLISDAEKVGRERGDQRGYAEGMARGQKQGAEEAREQIGQDLQRLAVAWGDALEHFETVRVALFREARLDVLKLAVAIAEKVAKKAIDADEHAAAAQLEAALEMISRPTRLRIACSPADKQLLTDLMPALHERFGKVASAEVVEDASLSRGSVVVRTEKGEIDATIETQIARVIGAILPDRNATAMPNIPAPPEPAPADDESEASDG
jgi:flagellar biosynthesis/type III secretory pathway protein FliH